EMRHHHADHDPGEDAHAHDHGEGHGHTHAHGIVDPFIASNDRGLWALKWSFVGLMVTALIQTGVVLLSGSVALLADTIHNFADAATAIPLGVAFWLARRGATPRFTYGLGRVEDLAGLAILVGAIAVWAGYPLADPVVGLLISIAIFVLVWQSAGSILLRTLDGVETQALQDIVHAARPVPGVTEVTDVRARWIGHRLHA